MRTVLASLIATAGLATGLATGAQAQVAATTPAPVTMAPTPVAPVPAPDASAAPAAPAVSASVAEAPPPPSLPTTGDGATVLSILERICVPAVRGEKLDILAKAAGMKMNRRDQTWAMSLGGQKNYQIIVLPQGSNKDVCQAEVRYAPGADQPIVQALNVWSFLHQPELILQANYVAVDPDGIKRVRKSWENLTSTNSTAVNFSTMRKADDTALNRNFDQAMLFYQERKF